MPSQDRCQCPPSDFPARIATRQFKRYVAVLITLAGILSGSLADAQTAGARFEVCEFDPETKQTVVLFEVSDVADVGSIAWNSEAKRFAIGVITTTADGRTRHRIRICRRDGSEVQDIGRGQLPSWSPRGRRLTFSRESPDGGVWIMRVDGTDAQIIDSKGWSARWSPDGNRIAYLRSDMAPSEIRIFNIVEGDFRRIRIEETTSDVKYAEGFAWSPDGSQLCCVRKADSTGQQLEVLNLKSDKHRVLATEFVLRAPNICWHDGREILFTVETSRGLRIATVQLAEKVSYETLPISDEDEVSYFGPEYNRTTGTVVFVRSVAR